MKNLFSLNRPHFYKKVPLTQRVRRRWDKKALFTEDTRRF